MNGATIEQFIERLRTDEALRQRILEAENAAARDINRGTDAITQIAAQEGFDIRGWPGRAITEVPLETESDFGCCTLTCCLAYTSATIAEDRPSP
jgi:hypothetical protein